MQSAVTVTLLPEAKAGPFVFADLGEACATAKGLGFDALEIFPPSAQAVETAGRVVHESGLAVAAVGTGGGWVRHKLSLTHPDAEHRHRAREFVRSLVDVAASFGAPAIVGSMQGRWGEQVSRETAFGYLSDTIEDLGAHAARLGVPLLYEPLNRYETNLINTLEEAARFVSRLGGGNVRILADLFHQNIEEADIAASIRATGGLLGHVHWADSNRRAAGLGHTDFAPIAAALRDIGYSGYISAEALPMPDSRTAARKTIESIRKHFPG
jgi:sugar phosphate isomerase/epimerase